MEARRNPAYLRAVRQAVEDFQAAFSSFLELHVVNGGPGEVFGGLARGIAPAVFVKNGVDPVEVERRRQITSEAAGRAAAASTLTNVFFSVQGTPGKIDPFVNWETVAQPKPLLEPSNILNSCGFAIGRLEGLILEAEAAQPPRIGAEALHPSVWGAASRLWRDGHYRQAVTAAAEAVVLMLKTRLERADIAETALWQEAYSDQPPKPGKPRLRWPGNPSDQDVKTMTAGLRFFAPGVQMTIRNSAAHGVGEMDQQEAIERLSTLSLLARWLDACEVETFTEPSPVDPLP